MKKWVGIKFASGGLDIQDIKQGYNTD